MLDSVVTSCDFLLRFYRLQKQIKKIMINSITTNSINFSPNWPNGKHTGKGLQPAKKKHDFTFLPVK